MGFKDLLSDALGSVVRAGLDVATDALRKAQEPPEEGDPGASGLHTEGEGMESDTGSTAMVVAGVKPTALPPDPASESMRGLLYDPFALIDQLGYRDRPSGLTYSTLREMGRRVPTYLAVEMTRITQVGAFAQPQSDKRDPGFEIKLRDDRAVPDKEDRRRMIQLTDWVMQTGATWGPGRDDFSIFLSKLIRDSLELDQGCFEIVRARKGTPAEFYCLDGATIRLADVPPGAEGQIDRDTVRFVQVYDEVIIAEFGAYDLSFGVRNPRSDIRTNGYGYSELEMLIAVVTASLWAFEHNRRFFSQGSAAKGILNFKGSVPDSKLDAFRRQWQMMLTGTANAFRTPMTNVDDLQWISLSNTNRDMEFSAWMDWLIKVTCAVMQFDPAEINFTYGNTGQGQQMFATPVDQKLKASKDRGLRPLLLNVAKWLNVHLIWQLDPRYKLDFVGLDTKTADQAVALGKQKSTFLMTVDELRAEDDLPPLPNGEGAVILDPTWMQGKQAAAAAQQQQQQPQGAMGEPPMEPGQEEMPDSGEPPQPTEGAPPDAMSVFGNPEDQGQEKALRGSTLQKAAIARRVTRTVIRYDIDL